MSNNVAQFISHFQNRSSDEVFSDLSYWFAYILFRRFLRDGAKIMYDMRGKRFGAGIDGHVYDITGDVTDSCRWVPWNSVPPERQESIIKTQIMI